MKKNEVIYKLSIALFCAVLGIIVGSFSTYLIAVYLFDQDLNQAIFTIVAFGLIGSQLGIGFGLKLAHKLYRKRKNTL